MIVGSLLKERIALLLIIKSAVIQPVQRIHRGMCVSRQGMGSKPHGAKMLQMLDLTSALDPTSGDW